MTTALTTAFSASNGLAALAHAGAEAPTRRGATLPERFFCLYVSAVPLLWLLGLTLPAALLGVVAMAALCVRSQRAVAYALPWALVGLCQLLSVGVNMLAEHQPAWMLVKHSIATYVSGWLLIAGAIAIGASGTIRPRPFLTAVARIGFWAVALGVLLYPLAFASGEVALLVRTPVGLFLPASLPSTSFFFSVLLFNWEDLLGVPLPRLSLFSPWTTAMGFSGLCLLFVCLNEPRRARRRVAVACALFMVVASCSRLAFLTLAVTMSAYWTLGRTRRVRAAVACTLVGLASALVIWSGGTPVQTLRAASDALKDMRPSASNARDLVDEETWAGITSAPLIGHGWPGEPLFPSDFPQVMEGDSTMVPGSHSTYQGLAYKGGILTAGAFVLALVAAAGLAAWSPRDHAVARTTACLVLTMAMTGLGECLDTLAVPSLFAFLWLGIALRQCRVGDQPITLPEPVR